MAWLASCLKAAPRYRADLSALGGDPPEGFVQELFPTVVFRQAWDALQETEPGRRGDLVYLRVLHLAASTLESEVETALSLMLESGEALTFDGVKALTQARVPSSPELSVPEVELGGYDALVPSMAREVGA